MTKPTSSPGCCSSASPRTPCSAAPTSALGSGISPRVAQSRGKRPRASDRALDRTGLGSQPRVADLLPRRALDRVLGSLRLGDAHAVRPADARRARHRAARIELRVPQGARAHAAATRVRRPLRHLVGDRALLHGRGGRRDRVGPGARPAARPAIRGRAGSTRRRSSAVCSRSPCAPTSRPCTSCGTPGASATMRWSSTSASARSSLPSWPGVVAFVGIFVLHADATYVFHGLTSRALPLVILSGLCGVISLWMLVHGAHRGARVLSAGAVATVIWAWGVAQWEYILPTSLKVSDAAAPSGTLTAVLVVFGVAAVTIIPSLGFLYVLDQKSLLPEESVDTHPTPGPTSTPWPSTTCRARAAMSLRRGSSPADRFSRSTCSASSPRRSRRSVWGWCWVPRRH